ncbi:MAG: M67 family metallopeptidase [Actinomycetota bacterium]|nr:M67 family metallopeptidase [Actinomycetota bacterium]
MTETVRIPTHLADVMVEHCKSQRPNEGCGVLAAADGRVVEVFRMTNSSVSPVRFSLDPKEQLAVYNKLDAMGWDLGGVFHSHTRTEAYPSPTDVRLASEDVPYLIVSLMKDPATIRAFRIVKENWTDKEGEIEEIDVEIVS